LRAAIPKEKYDLEHLHIISPIFPFLFTQNMRWIFTRSSNRSKKRSIITPKNIKDILIYISTMFFIISCPPRYMCKFDFKRSQYLRKFLYNFNCRTYYLGANSIGWDGSNAVIVAFAGWRESGGLVEL